MIIKTANQSGKHAEEIAATYLANQGITILDKNFRCRFGEIDLIGLDKQCLVFIEVRYRKNEKHMAVIETIDKHKCRKLVITSEYYLNKHPIYRKSACRYDFIGITGELEMPGIEWIKNAFQA